MGWFTNLFSKAKDIELPSESLEPDPRLPKSWPAEKASLQNAGRKIRDTAAQRDAILRDLQGK